MSRSCNRLRFGTLLWVVMSAGCGAAQPAEERQVRYVAETMNIREQPGTSGRVLRKALPGSVLQIGLADNNGWAVVLSGVSDTTGYVYARSSHLTRTALNPADVEQLGLAADSILSALATRCGQSRQEVSALADRGRRLLSVERRIQLSHERFIRELDRSFAHADSAISCADAAAFVVLAPPT
jgi:hypothetical protein